MREATDWFAVAFAVLLVGYLAQVPARFDCWRGVQPACDAITAGYSLKEARR